MGLFDFWKIKKKNARTTKKSVVKKITKKSLKKLPKKPLKKLKEKEIGLITHYFGKISVAIIKLKAGLKVGDKINIQGARNNFTQKIKSMQVNHKDIVQAKRGFEVGVKVSKPVHENDKVYKIG